MCFYRRGFGWCCLQSGPWIVVINHDSNQSFFIHRSIWCCESVTMDGPEAFFIWLNSQDACPLPLGNGNAPAIFMEIDIGEIVRKMIKFTHNICWTKNPFFVGGNEEIKFDVGGVWLAVAHCLLKPLVFHIFQNNMCIHICFHTSMTLEAGWCIYVPILEPSIFDPAFRTSTVCHDNLPVGHRWKRDLNLPRPQPILSVWICLAGAWKGATWRITEFPKPWPIGSLSGMFTIVYLHLLDFYGNRQYMDPIGNWDTWLGSHPIFWNHFDYLEGVPQPYLGDEN